MNNELTVTEVAQGLGVTVQAVSSYLRTGKMSGIKIGGRWRVPSQSVEDFLIKSNSKIIGGLR